jgi:MoxR-like ATPase
MMKTVKGTFMSKSNANRDNFLAAAKKHFKGDVSEITRAQANEVLEKFNLPYPTWLFNDAAVRVGRGVYSLTANGTPKAAKVRPISASEANKAFKKPRKAAASKAAPAKDIESFVPVVGSADMVAMTPGVSVDHNATLVPEKSSGYVPFGNFADVRSIVKSKKFYPIYVTGLSGNGKTLMIEQVAASEKRELIRVNITIETDEDDLIGGFRLIDGHTVWQDGPVITAMQRGAVLLLDEVDLGSNKMMCLQPVLEGKAVYLKKTNRVVHPEKGFNIIATANTKGKGSDDGRFIGTNVMNEAFLERFSITMEQDYPPIKTETKILKNVLGASGIEANEFIEKLVQWGDVIRKSFKDGALTEIISTRRLVHICEAYAIFNQNREKAIQLCLNRFDEDTKNAFMELYKKVDETIDPADVAKSAPTDDTEVAF